MQLFNRAAMSGAGVATLAAGRRRSCRRESLVDGVDAAYRQLIRSEPDPDRALEWAGQAKERAAARRQARPASGRCCELEVQIERGDPLGVQAALNEIRQHHLNEPGVADATYQLLYTAGLLVPRGPRAGRACRGRTLRWTPAARADRGRIWTPGQDAPAARRRRQVGDLDAVTMQRADGCRRRRSPLHGAGPGAGPPRRGAASSPIRWSAACWCATAQSSARAGTSSSAARTPRSRPCAAAGDAARGATAYVTLEPCCHTGKTPPCTQALIAAGVARVVAACSDPNPAVNGGGLAELAAAGVAVETGVLADEAGGPDRAVRQAGHPAAGRG